MDRCPSAGSLVFALALLLVTSVSFAQDSSDQGPNGLISDGKAVESPAMNMVETAADLAAYGLSERDPVALVSAARILIMQNTEASNATRESGGPVDTSEKNRPDVEFSPEGLLGAARQMADGSEALTQLIDDAESMMGQLRGREPGPGRFSGRVSARSTDVYNLGNFRGGEPAEVRVRGDGDTDLDCYIYDENGNRIDSDTDMTDYCILRWHPRWTGPFRLYIRNLGSVWNGYYGATN